jgi:hypothetical protein
MGTTLKGGGLSKQTLDAVVSDAKASTQAFADSLKSLGTPPVSDSQASDIFENLRSQLQKGADSIKSATADVSGVTEVLEAVSWRPPARRSRTRSARFSSWTRTAAYGRPSTTPLPART